MFVIEKASEERQPGDTHQQQARPIHQDTQQGRQQVPGHRAPLRNAGRQQAENGPQKRHGSRKQQRKHANIRGVKDIIW